MNISKKEQALNFLFLKGCDGLGNQAFNQVADLIINFSEILKFIPESVKAETYDIRLKVGQPLMIFGRRGALFVSDKGGVSFKIGQDTVICRQIHMKEIFMKICSHSVFSHENEIKEGFVSTTHGYRVGLCGTAVLEENQVKNITDISTLVFRIPRENRGCADVLFQSPINFSSGILIVGEPSSGKTTFLRDICQSLSFGSQGCLKRISILDERGEISGSFDIGPCADVLKYYPKKEGFQMALRSLSPQIIACDEIADKDLTFIEHALFSGVPVIGTLHGSEFDLKRRANINRILSLGGFETLIFLKGRNHPSEILKIERVSEWLENNRYHDDSAQWINDRND